MDVSGSFDVFFLSVPMDARFFSRSYYSLYIRAYVLGETIVSLLLPLGTPSDLELAQSSRKDLLEESGASNAIKPFAL